jgi:hypothetical protein
METLHLEGFSESIRGKRVLCVASNPTKAEAFLKGNRESRGKHILIHQAASVIPRWLQRLGWDTTFHIRDTQDLKLALTVVQHCTKPVQVVWTGGEPAPNVLALLAKIEVGLVCVGDRAPVSEWDAVFWTPGSSIEDVEPFVTGHMGSQPRLKSILSELRSSDVGLVWSSIREERKGSLYWYDPAEGDAAPMDPEETADVLRRVADSFSRLK